MSKKHISFKSWALGLSSALLLTLSPLASAEDMDELAPGLNACLTNATAESDIIACVQAGYDYWEKQVESNYIAALAFCQTDIGTTEGEEAAAKCRAQVSSAHKSWQSYRDAMTDYLGFTSLNRGGSMERFDVLYSLTQMTRDHAFLLAIPQAE